MKKLFTIILAAVMLLSLAGCGLFADPQDNASNQEEDTRTEAHGDPISRGDVTITDSYTHIDPDGLEFDHRHVLYCNNNDAMIMQGAPFGVTVNQMFFVLYGGEERPVACYEYCVFPSAEEAETYVNACAGFWTTAKAEGNVSVMYKDSEKIDADLITYAGYGMISEETCDQYLDATSTMYCYVPLE